MGKYFGTDGFRGEAGVELTSLHAYNIGLYLGYLASKEPVTLSASGKIGRPCILLGRDTRHSGAMLGSALSAGITTMGADVYDVGVITTPGVACLTHGGRYVFGVMISASHNPFYDNGIKILNSRGEKLEEEVIGGLEAFLGGAPRQLKLACREHIGTVRDSKNLTTSYIENLEDIARCGCAEFVDRENRPFSGWEIGLDCANGSASALAGQLFRELGANVLAINTRPDGFNINVDCGSTHIANLCRSVVDNGLDLGFAFDGDADRCIAVDSTGNVVDGDKIMYLCGTYLAKRGELKNNTVVTTVMSNLGLYKALDAQGIAYEKTAVGDKYVYENMTKNGHSLGGEQSGHVIFGDYATTGDGMLTAIMVMTALIGRGKSLREAVEGMKVYPQVLKNIRVSDKDGVLQSPRIRSAIEAVERDLGDNGRILVRKSGTEPLIRVMVEAEDTETCRDKVDAIIALIQKSGFAIED